MQNVSYPIVFDFDESMFDLIMLDHMFNRNRTKVTYLCPGTHTECADLLGVDLEIEFFDCELL